MKLNQYPAAIAEAARSLNALDQQIAELRRSIAHVEGRADLVVAFETSLKNDNQRRARNFEILDGDPEYRQLQDRMLLLAAEKANALAHLEHMRNQFSVAKLEMRQAIADKLVGIEARELVDLQV